MKLPRTVSAMFRRAFGRLLGWSLPPVRAKFDAAQTNASNANHWANADLLSARAANSPAVRQVLRKRSRYEAANNSWYAGILRTAANHIVGNGPRVQVLTGDPAVNARIEKAWRKWSRSVNLADKLRVMVETYWRDGEVFAMRKSRPRLYPISLDIGVYEAEQVASPFVGATFDASVEDGIRIDDATNEIEYYIYDHHPGDAQVVNTFKGAWYPARDVLHLFRPDRPGQVRGIPRATPSLPLFAVMRRHTLATLFAAEAAANNAMFMKSTMPAVVPSVAPSDFAEVDYARNMMTILPEGWEPFQVKPEHPTTNHEMFQRQTLGEIARCMNVPYGLASGTSKDSNFSSFKGDVKNTWQPEVETEQDRVEISIVEPIWRWFLEESVFVPGLLDGAPAISEIEHQWFWPPLPTLDENDAANAAATRVATGQSSLSQEHAANGQDFDTACIRAASDFGVDVPTLKAAYFAKSFGITGPLPVPGSPAAPPATPVAGEYTEIGQRAFNNNMKRIRRVLDDLIAGTTSQVMAEQTLQSIGLSPDRVATLIQDAMDGQVSDPELAGVAA